MDKYDLYWLAGFLEGEGSFMKGSPSTPNLPVIQVSSTDEDVIAKASKLFGVSYWQIDKKRSIKNGWKIPYATRIRGKKAVDLMENIKPLMGIRRQSQIDEALSCYSVSSYKLTEDIVKNIKFALKTSGLTQGQIGKKFDLRRETINKISRGKTWSHVEI
jgi:hypothetical protein